VTQGSLQLRQYIAARAEMSREDAAALAGIGLEEARLTDIETWLPISGYEGIYEVSSLGRVRSLPRIFTRKMPDGSSQSWLTKLKVLRPGTRRGYRYVCLYRDGGKLTHRVHRLVIQAFGGPPPSPDAMCCHGDGNRGHNAPRNLRWGTGKDNAADRLKHGTEAIGERARTAKLTEQDVVNIRRRHSAGASTRLLARDYKISASNAWAVCNNKTWRHIA
jgi:hypothetical protein